MVLDVASFGADPRRRAAELFEAGADWIQLRERTAEDLALFEAACSLVQARDGMNANDSRNPRRVLINKRTDIARAARADGVHLGFDAVNPQTAREAFGSGTQILAGRSLHDLDEVAHLAQSADAIPMVQGKTEYAPGEGGVDYVHLAPIWAPNSKPASRPPHGPEVLAEACRLGLPVFAQGGIDASRAGEAILVGAAGVAVTGELARGASPKQQLGPIRSALDRAYADHRAKNV